MLRITRKAGKRVEIEHKKPRHGPAHRVGKHADADPAAALDAVRQAGWEAWGDPQRHPKHFEVLARKEGVEWMELHVDFSGDIYKQKPAAAHKWNVK